MRLVALALKLNYLINATTLRELLGVVFMNLHKVLYKRPSQVLRRGDFHSGIDGRLTRLIARCNERHESLLNRHVPHKQRDRHSSDLQIALYW